MNRQSKIASYMRRCTVSDFEFAMNVKTREKSYARTRPQRFAVTPEEKDLQCCDDDGRRETFGRQRT